MQKRFPILFILLFSSNLALSQNNHSSGKRKISGVNLVSPRTIDSNNYLSTIKRVSANWVAIVPYAFMNNGDPTISYNVNENWWGDTPEGINNSCKQAREQNINILLKPHFWMDGKSWAGELSLTDEQWFVWEKNYEAFILKMALFAKENKVNMLCIGTELKSAIGKRPSFWKGLIPKIRNVYSGDLIYAANWDNYLNIPFWNQLDYIGIDSYFPLLNTKTPKTSNLLFAWEKPKWQIKKLCDSLNKKVIFTEMGYRSTNYTAWKQWLIESQSDDVAVNMEAQTNAYLALFDCFWAEEWFAGGFLWKWNHPNAISGGKNNSDYTPQNKPVEEIIKSWYEKKCL